MRLYLIAAAFLVASPALAEPFDGLGLETATWRAYRDKDVQAFSALIAPDFVGVYADGVHDKARDLELLHKTTLKSFTLSEFKSRRIDSKDMLVTYAAEATTATKAQQRIWNASLWRLEKGRWRTVYHTEVAAKPGA